MKRNSLMEECRKLITPEIKRSVELSVYVADQIMDILDKKQLTQRQLAKRLGKSETEISKWLQGTHNFTLATIAKIESALDEKIIITAREENHVQPSSCTANMTSSFTVRCVFPISSHKSTSIFSTDKWNVGTFN